MVRELPWTVTDKASPARRSRQPQAADKGASAAPLTEEYMRCGMDQDDKWRMVEDEFLTVARLFTAHLHAAEYERRMKEVRDSAAGGTQRPVDGSHTTATELQTKRDAPTTRQSHFVEQTGSTIHGPTDTVPAVAVAVATETSTSSTLLELLLARPLAEAKDAVVPPLRVTSAAGRSRKTRAAAGFTSTVTQQRQQQHQNQRGQYEIDTAHGMGSSGPKVVSKKEEEPEMHDKDTTDATESDNNSNSGDLDAPIMSARPRRPAPPPHSTSLPALSRRPPVVPSIPFSDPVTAENDVANGSIRTIIEQEAEAEAEDDEFGVLRQQATNRARRQRRREAQAQSNPSNLATTDSFSLDHIPNF